MVALRLRFVFGCTIVLAASLTVARSLYAQYPQSNLPTPESSYPPYSPPNFATPPGAPYSQTAPLPRGPQQYASPDVYEAQDKGLAPKTSTPAPGAGGFGYTGALPPTANGVSGAAGERIVREVRFEGNHTTDVRQLRQLRTRKGQPYDHQLVMDDVRYLNSDSRFLDAKVQLRELPDGVEVIFQVVERAMIKDVIFVGNQDKTTRKLTKESQLQKGGALDPYQVEDTRRRLEQFYHEQGYAHASVKVLDGDDLKDSNAVFSVHEGQAEKIYWTSFEGNTVAGDNRLRTQIQTSRTIMWTFGGKVDRKKIEEDVQRLTSYYRSLGYFNARVGRILEFGESKKWLTVRFIIDEGPRFKIRNVSFLGNEKFAHDTLHKDLVLKAGESYNQASLNKDVALLRDIYGGHGYVFADVQADMRLAEDKPEVDLVYGVKEGLRYRAGRININIQGEHPHTSHAVILNRMSIKPGDIIDTRKLRDDERRIMFSQVFEADPTKGGPPKFTLNKPDEEDRATAASPSRGTAPPRTGSTTPPNYRGQSPDDVEVDLVFVRHGHGKTAPVDSYVGDPQGKWHFVERQRPDIDPEVPDAASVRMQSPDGWGGAQKNYWQGYGANQATPPASPWGNAQAQPAAAASTPRTASASPYLPSRAQALPPSAEYSPGTPRTTSANPTYTGTFPSAPAAPVSTPSYTQTPASTAPPPYSPMQNPVAPPASNWDPYNSNPQPPAYNPSMYGPPAGTPVNGAPVYGSNAQPYVVQQQPGYGGNTLVTPPGGAAPGVNSPFDPNTGPVVGDQTPIFTPPDPTIEIGLNPTERQTGRLMLGVGVNSDAGLVGNFVLDEQNFDITRLPRSWEDIRNGQAWRGNGQRFRIEANPGTVVQRYAVTFQEPYLFGTPNQLDLSGFYFTRIYRDWNEERTGGRVGVGRLLTPDLRVRGAFRGEQVTIFNPSTDTVEQLNEVVGNNTLLGFGTGITHDTRDSPFLPTQGHLLSADVEYVTGSFNYPRVIVEGRQYFLIRQRPDGSGRHTFSLGGVFGVTGDNTPIYDNFFAGGFSTLRGFAFRGASPMVRANDTSPYVQVGGQLELLGTTEYMFPITADDALRGVISCDFGTVEQNVSINKFRVAPGFGFRINVPAMGPAPLAFDFNFPIVFDPTDQRQVFAFFVAAAR